MYYLHVISFDVFNSKFYYYMAFVMVLFVLLTTLSTYVAGCCIGAEADCTETLKINNRYTILYDIESYVKNWHFWYKYLSVLIQTYNEL
jgi:hypothetical protein